MTSHLSEALQAAAAGLQPDEAGTCLIISHGIYLRRDDFARYVRTAVSITDGPLLAWANWDAAITALASGHLPSSGSEQGAQPSDLFGAIVKTASFQICLRWGV